MGELILMKEPYYLLQWDAKRQGFTEEGAIAEAADQRKLQLERRIDPGPASRAASDKPISKPSAGGDDGDAQQAAGGGDPEPETEAGSERDGRAGAAVHRETGGGVVREMYMSGDADKNNK